MNDNEPYIIATNEAKAESVSKNSFPVFSQAFLILILLGGLFGGLFFANDSKILSKDHSPQNANLPFLQAGTSTEIIPQKIESTNIIAKSAYVWDVKEQRVLFQKNENTALPLASITKLMTALVAYELVSDETKVTVTKDAASQQSGGSLNVGEVFAVKDLADFALVSSYNSAAYTLADAVGAKLGDKDPVAQFVTGMNIRAEELSLGSLKFMNPTGLDISTEEAGAYGTARDVSFLMEYIIRNHPDILEPTKSDITTLYNTAGGFHQAKNTNNIVDKIPNLIGSKTGYTDLAGGNLTVALDIGFNHPVIITVLGSTIDGRFSDVTKLIEAVQDSVTSKE
ncbi:MAG: D-alanyl-D-alanine carboxypeptidase [Candidatus Pacebacteria bacterium]|nr:D-alanyl-D-alanine carboxypeptidase [Candidatus Paceibacterota bacterium]